MCRRTMERYPSFKGHFLSPREPNPIVRFATFASQAPGEETSEAGEGCGGYQRATRDEQVVVQHETRGGSGGAAERVEDGYHHRHVRATCGDSTPKDHEFRIFLDVSAVVVHSRLRDNNAAEQGDSPMGSTNTTP